MIEQIYTYFTIETLYMWINLGVLPFWFILIVFPQSHLSRIFVTSIFPFFVLSGVYIFILYKSYLIGYDFDGNFSLYLGLSELSRLFEDHLYIMIFWTHFIAINLFIGGWIVKDSQKFSINKVFGTCISFANKTCSAICRCSPWTGITHCGFTQLYISFKSSRLG